MPVAVWAPRKLRAEQVAVRVEKQKRGRGDVDIVGLDPSTVSRR